MKILLAGYEGSKKIIKASSWLLNKYLPEGFEVRFLNFGKFEEFLYKGEFVSLDNVQHGGSMNWARYLRHYIAGLDDEFLIFGLDDYLLSGPFNEAAFESLLSKMKADESIVSGRLCATLDQGLELFPLSAGCLEVRSGSAYCVTAQYCIWRRAYLVELLGRVQTAWDFELKGSEILGVDGKRTIGTIVPVMAYPDASCLSAKWRGIRVFGNRHSDIEDLVEIGALERGALC